VETAALGRTAASNVIRSARTRLGMDVAGEVERLTRELESIEKRLG